MAIDYATEDGNGKRIRKFIRMSRKVTGTNLNKQPGVQDDYANAKSSLKKSMGEAKGPEYQERLHNKPMKVRKVVKGNGGESKLTAKKPNTKRPKARKPVGNRYK